MISRIRIDLHGSSAAEVEARAAAFYNWLTGQQNAGATATYVGGGNPRSLKVDIVGGTNSGTNGPMFRYVGKGELVIERDLNEPEDSAFAYKGRAIFHPDISTEGAPVLVEEDAA